MEEKKEILTEEIKMDNDPKGEGNGGTGKRINTG